MECLGEYTDECFHTHRVLREISRGAQGAVYRTEDPDTAIKLVLGPDEMPVRDPAANERIRMLRQLPVPHGLPVTMPLAVLRDYAGYTMRLLNDMVPFSEALEKLPENAEENSWIEKTFSDGDSILKKSLFTYVSTGGARKRLEAYLRAAQISAKLHGAGLVYCDYSENNLFLSSSPDSTAVWFIDTDNLCYRSELHGGVYTQSFCAPEAPRGKLGFFSDCYAFAVLLFKHLVMAHPFEGEAYHNSDFSDDRDPNERLSLGEYAWILDPEDNSNQAATPVPWEYVIGDGLYTLFLRTFSEEGRRRPGTRPTMMEWADILAQQLDQTVRCPRCGMDHSTADAKCPWCDGIIPLIRVRTRHLQDGEPASDMWNMIRELGAGPIPVPLRAVTGDSMSDPDEIAFTAEFTDTSVWISQINNDALNVFLRQDGYDQQIYGTREISGRYVVLIAEAKAAHIKEPTDLMNMKYFVEVEGFYGTDGRSQAD